MYRYNSNAAIREEDEYIDAVVTPRSGNYVSSVQNAAVKPGAVTSSSTASSMALANRQRFSEQQDEQLMMEAQTKFKNEVYQEGENGSPVHQQGFTLDWFFWTMAAMTLVFLSLVGYGFGSGLYLPNKSNMNRDNLSSINDVDTSNGFAAQQGDLSVAGSSSQAELGSSLDQQDYKYSLLTLLGLPPVIQRSSPQARAIEWLAFDDDPLFDTNELDLSPEQTKRLEQRYALVVWYFAHGGPSLWTTLNREVSSGWIEHGAGVHECDWRGVDCEYSNPEDETNGAVIGLRLSNSMGLLMTGSSMATELGMLTDLRRIDFSDQRLQGKIPDEWSKLTNLELLVFSQNQLQSTIPEWIAEWTNLQHLALDGNQFYGTIPSSIASLQNLEHLELQENPQLRGSFDVLFSKFEMNSTLEGVGPQKSLQHLDLSNTDLEGVLPNTIFPSLTFLRLWDTKGLGGTLPSEIGSWSNLEYFSIKQNPKLVGSIPTEFGLLQNLKTLELVDSNFMSGTLPTELGNLSSNL